MIPIVLRHQSDTWYDTDGYACATSLLMPKIWSNRCQSIMLDCEIAWTWQLEANLWQTFLNPGSVYNANRMRDYSQRGEYIYPLRIIGFYHHQTNKQLNLKHSTTWLREEKESKSLIMLFKQLISFIWIAIAGFMLAHANETRPSDLDTIVSRDTVPQSAGSKISVTDEGIRLSCDGNGGRGNGNMRRRRYYWSIKLDSIDVCLYVCNRHHVNASKTNI